MTFSIFIKGPLAFSTALIYGPSALKALGKNVFHPFRSSKPRVLFVEKRICDGNRRLIFEGAFCRRKKEPHVSRPIQISGHEASSTPPTTTYDGIASTATTKIISSANASTVSSSTANSTTSAEAEC